VTTNEPDPTDELLAVPRAEFTEVTYELSETPIGRAAGVDIIGLIREIPRERIMALSSKLRLGDIDPRANGWSDHYSQSTDGGWRDSWKDQKGLEIPVERIPGIAIERQGPGFERR
jgi:hypothetical protein